MERTPYLVELVKLVINLINKNLKDGCTRDNVWYPRKYSTCYFENIFFKRREELDKKVKEIEEIFRDREIERLINSKTKIEYSTRSVCDFKEGQILQNLGNHELLILSNKGRKIKRHYSQIIYRGEDSKLHSFLFDEVFTFPGNFEYKLYRSYNEFKIPKTWMKYA